MSVPKTASLSLENNDLGNVSGYANNEVVKSIKLVLDEHNIVAF